MMAGIQLAGCIIPDFRLSEQFREPNWSEYKVLTLDRYAIEVLAICRTANGPARDDIAIDAVEGCAFRTR